MMMSTTFGTPTTVAGRRQKWGSGLVSTLKRWWSAYLTRRLEQAAILQLHAMSDRELRDIGLDRSQIERSVRGEVDHRPFTRYSWTGDRT